MPFDQRFGARKYSTAPAASAAAPEISCACVAPARMPSATIDARIGITGPNGTVNFGGATACSRIGEVRADLRGDLAIALAQHQRRHAHRQIHHQPRDRADRGQRDERSGQRERSAPRRRRTGSRSTACGSADAPCANQRGRSPFSASAKIVREPFSSWPMLLPVIETTEPIEIIAAPPAPMKIAAPSASGVLRRGEIRQHAGGDQRRQRHHDRHDDQHRDERERHVLARVRGFAGQHAGDLVAAIREDQQDRRAPTPARG